MISILIGSRYGYLGESLLGTKYSSILEYFFPFVLF